ncbi:hypothetical protein [Roseimaritima ulvae]|uniref:hypothetical protein n=1 Tax=Roseimaritima ulvae TaxID=980254 RepID=UPI00082DA3DD|nr:hypothetical protein [Roseimaritima ulvae]
MQKRSQLGINGLLQLRSQHIQLPLQHRNRDFVGRAPIVQDGTVAHGGRFRGCGWRGDQVALSLQRLHDRGKVLTVELLVLIQIARRQFFYTPLVVNSVRDHQSVKRIEMAVCVDVR